MTRTWKIPSNISPIPSPSAPLDLESYPGQVYLLCTNTGNLYSLDAYEYIDSPEITAHGRTIYSWGYDEVSESQLRIEQNPDTRESLACLDHRKGIVSIHRMKTLFCEDCIQSLLPILEQSLVPEFVIMDGTQKEFYPINSGAALQIGDYTVAVSSDTNSYWITLSPADADDGE